MFTVIILNKNFSDAKGQSSRLDPADTAIKLEEGYITESRHNHIDCNIIGSPVDVALLKYADVETDIEEVRNCFPKLMEIPFNPIRRWQLTISRCQRPPQGVDVDSLPEMEEDDVVNVVMVKGDPVAVLKKCKYWSCNGELRDVDREFEHECKVTEWEKVFLLSFKNFLKS